MVEARKVKYQKKDIFKITKFFKDMQRFLNILIETF